jgi:uncharacterized protein
MTMPPQSPPVPPDQERTWSAVAHIGTLLAAWIALGLLCPLVVWLMYRDRSEFVRRHALESLNFQISLLIYLAVSVVVGIVTFGLALFVLLPALGIFALVVIIMATVAAARGDDYRYPLSIRMVR